MICAEYRAWQGCEIRWPSAAQISCRAARGLAVLAILLTLPWAHAAAPPAESDAPRPASLPGATIEQLIRQLDSNHYVQRRLATESLIDAGPPAIAPLLDAIPKSNREVATRGVHVLRALAMADQSTSDSPAVTALEQLAARRGTSAGRLAAAALKVLSQQREQRAIARLQELGAQISTRVMTFGFERRVSRTVELGEAFEGTVDDVLLLKWLTDVPELRLVGKRVNDSWIPPVTRMSGLVRIVISHANVSDRALQEFSSLNQLRVVDLLYTPFTDVCLNHLQHVKNLQALRLYGTQITDRGVKGLKAKLTTCTIDLKQGAFMGVHCLPMTWPCEVSQVNPATGAARAGIKATDTIIEYDGRTITRFEELKEGIAANRAGQTVRVKLGKGKTFRVQIARAAASTLGVEGTGSPYGFKITRLQPGGIAGRSALRVGDVIGILNNQRVTSDESLKKAFSEWQKAEAGSTCVVVLRRDAAVTTVQLTCGEWDIDDIR